MQIFELHFNPKKEERFFDSFVYEPESSYEKKLGSLYIAGELKNSLPSNFKLLDTLAQVIKKNYYILSAKTAEKALSHASKKANEFLAEQVKKENVDWLGNLSFAVFCLNNYNIAFTKTGDIKILLLRGGQIIDAGANLDMEEIEPYPLKIFFNVVSGNLIENDKIVIITKEVFEFLQQRNIISKIAKTENLDHKNIRQILPPSLFNKGEGANVSGICLINVLTAEPQKRTGPIFFQNNTRFSLSKLVSPVFKKIPLPKISLPKLPKVHLPKIPKLRLPQIKRDMAAKKTMPIIERFKKQKNNKKLLLIALLIIIAFLGFYLFKARPEKEEKELKAVLEQVQEKLDQAENLIIIGNEQEANNLLQQAWLDLSSWPEKEQALSLKQDVEDKLKEINKLEYIAEPEIAAESGELLKGKEKLYALSGTNIFFSSSVYIYQNNNWQKKDIDPPFSNYSFSSYFSNLYFLNKENCQILKYSYKGGLEWGLPATWLENPGTECQGKSIAIDGSVWILNKNKSILRYYNGELKDEITLNFFPFPEDMVMRTKADIPYIYLLEQKNQRVIVIDKTGKIIKQFQSPKFDNLIDFDISNNGKTIYILNSSTIYKLEML